MVLIGPELTDFLTNFIFVKNLIIIENMENITVQETIESINNSFKKYPREQQRHNSKDFYSNIPRQKPVIISQPQKQCH